MDIFTSIMFTNILSESWKFDVSLHAMTPMFFSFTVQNHDSKHFFPLFFQVHSGDIVVTFRFLSYSNTKHKYLDLNNTTLSYCCGSDSKISDHCSILCNPSIEVDLKLVNSVLREKQTFSFHFLLIWSITVYPGYIAFRVR